MFVLTIFNEGAYLTKSVFHKAHIKMVFFAISYLKFLENLEKASVSLLMLSVKQGKHWYHFLNEANVIYKRSFWLESYMSVEVTWHSIEVQYMQILWYLRRAIVSGSWLLLTEDDCFLVKDLFLTFMFSSNIKRHLIQYMVSLKQHTEVIIGCIRWVQFLVEYLSDFMCLYLKMD